MDVSDRLIEATFRSMLYNVPKVLRNPNDYDARAEIMWAGTVAHNNLYQMGRILTGVPTILSMSSAPSMTSPTARDWPSSSPAWMKYVYKTDIKRFVQYAVRMFDVDLALPTTREIALKVSAVWKPSPSPSACPPAWPTSALATTASMRWRKRLSCTVLSANLNLYEEDVAAILRLAL